MNYKFVIYVGGGTQVNLKKLQRLLASALLFKSMLVHSNVQCCYIIVH